MSQAGANSISGGGGGGSNVQTLTGNTGGAVPPTANNINVVGDGLSCTIAGNPGTSTLTVSIINDGFPWTEQSANFNAQVQNGYFATAGLTMTLPPSAGLTLGNTIILVVDTASAVVVTANAGESIQVGNVIKGPASSFTSNLQGSVLELVFRPNDLTWHTISSLGTWT